MLDYEEYEKKCEAIRAANMELLAIFKKDLTAAGLSDKTINSYLSNAAFYINEYLPREGALLISFLNMEKYAPHGTKNRKNGIFPLWMSSLS